MADKVVDASALAAILFNEPEGDAVESELAGHRLLAPTLLPYEMSSVCLKKLRQHPKDRDAILARFRKLPRIPIDLRNVDSAAVVEVARLLNLSAYDASYLLLARQNRAELVTLDGELAGAARL